MSERIELAKRFYAELRKDRTSNYVTPRHLWQLAYWRARFEASA